MTRTWEVFEGVKQTKCECERERDHRRRQTAEDCEFLRETAQGFDGDADGFTAVVVVEMVWVGFGLGSLRWWWGWFGSLGRIWVCRETVGECVRDGGDSERFDSERRWRLRTVRDGGD